MIQGHATVQCKVNQNAFISSNNKQVEYEKTMIHGSPELNHSPDKLNKRIVVH